MITPTLTQIAHHEAHGGLWRIIPARTSKEQPMPVHAVLGGEEPYCSPCWRERKLYVHAHAGRSVCP